MITTKTLTDILNTLPIIKNLKYKSPGNFISEVDTTYTGGINKSDDSLLTNNQFTGNDPGIWIEGKVVNNIK